MYIPKVPVSSLRQRQKKLKMHPLCNMSFLPVRKIKSNFPEAEQMGRNMKNQKVHCLFVMCPGRSVQIVQVKFRPGISAFIIKRKNFSLRVSTAAQKHGCHNIYYLL